MSEVLVSAAKRRRKLQILYVLFALGFAAAFAACFVSYSAACTLAVFYLFCVQPVTKRYQEQLTAEMVRLGVCQGFSRAEAVGKQAITDSVLAETPLLPLSGRRREVLCREGFTGTWRGLSVAGNEITLHFAPSGAGGKRGAYHFWSGTLLDVSWEEESPLRFALLCRGLAVEEVQSRFSAWRWVESPLTGTELGKRCLLLMPPDSGELPPGAIKRLERLSKAVKGDFALHVQDKHLTAYLNGRFYGQKLPVRQPVTEDLLTFQRLPERDAVLELAVFCA